MSLAVVRCPACLGASRVAAEALEQTVECPRCQAPFVAAEEVPVLQPARREKPAKSAPRTGRPRSRLASAIPVTPPRPRDLPTGGGWNGSAPHPDSPHPIEPDAPAIPDPVHDPHRRPVAGLPVSVLVGLALLPFGIPVLWWAAPALTGVQAALSLAVPAALSVAASALCLGVVYTIDWSAVTRVKGVLMLVGLAYLAAAGLFFLKKDMTDRLRGLLTDDPWTMVYSREGRFKVLMPGAVEKDDDPPLPNLKLRMNDGRRATYLTEREDEYVYLAKAGTPDRPVKPDDAWFTAIGDQLAQAGEVTDPRVVNLGDDEPGREWTLKMKEEAVRVVRVYVSGGRVYYLSVEGKNLGPADEDLVSPFFRSFQVTNANAKAKR